MADGSNANDSDSALKCVSCVTDLSCRSYASIKGASSVAEACQHTLCFTCFGRIQVERSANVKVKCPACQRSSREWSIHKFHGEIHSPPTVQKISLPTRGEDDKKCHPSLYFANKGPSYCKDRTILSISVNDPDNQRNVLAYSAELQKDHESNPDEEVDQLERISRSLTPFLLPDVDKLTRSHQAFANPHAGSIEQLEASDESPLRRFVHAVSTGKRFTNVARRGKQERRPLFQKEFNASYAVSETALRRAALPLDQ